MEMKDEFRNGRIFRGCGQRQNITLVKWKAKSKTKAHKTCCKLYAGQATKGKKFYKTEKINSYG